MDSTQLMDNKYFYFYDLNEVLIDRYPAQISGLLSEKIHTSNFVFIFSESFSSAIPKNIPVGSRFFFLKKLAKRDLEKIVGEFPPFLLVTIAQRIPDMWMLAFFNKMKIPTFLVQHGLWSDKLERIPPIKLFFHKFTRISYYVRYTFFICRMIQIPLLPTLIELYRFLILSNVDITKLNYLKSVQLRAKKAFVFDESWNDYYTVKYGYDIQDLVYIGNPDFQLLKNKDLSKKEDAVCYLCQSLVEDGRFLESDYDHFLSLLKNAMPVNKKLYIKLHPRSEVRLFSIFKDNENIELTQDLPFCKYYIGHYTGLLATVKKISDEILIWKLSNHHMPTYFFQFGSVITDDYTILSDFVNGKIPNTKVSNTAKEQNDTNYCNPIEIIVKELLEVPF